MIQNSGKNRRYYAKNTDAAKERYRVRKRQRSEEGLSSIYGSAEDSSNTDTTTNNSSPEKTTGNMHTDNDSQFALPYSALYNASKLLR